MNFRGDAQAWCSGSSAALLIWKEPDEAPPKGSLTRPQNKEMVFSLHGEEK